VAGAGVTNVDLLYSGLPRVPNEGEELFSKSFALMLGGGIPATLINLRRLGVACKAQTFLGEDIFSRFAAREFERLNTPVTNLYGGNGIPLNITSAVITPNDRTFISYSDNVPVGDKELSAVYEASRGADIVLMAASFLPIYADLKREGAVLVFDTGWTEGMTMESMRALLTLADYFTPNQKEAMRITGEHTPQAAAKALSRYIESPIVKLDKDGCLLMENGRARIIPPLRDIQIVDPTGAGDAFLAGLTYGLFHHAPLETAVRYGNVTGGVCVTGIGCLTNYVTEEELLAMAKLLD